MYTERMLRKYAAQIDDESQRLEFGKKVDQIDFDEEGLCSASALSVMEGTAVEDLVHDFRENFIHYTSPEDFQHT